MRIAILANVPVWTLPGLEHLRHNRHYATWLEPLIPEFAAFPDLEIHWITMCKETERDLTHRAHGQTFHILARGSMAVQMASGYATEILRIRKTIRSIQPDLVHAWGSEDVYGLAGSFSGVKKRIFTLQGCLTEYLRLLGGSALFRLQAMYEKPMIRRYGRATAESPAAADLLRGINPKLDIELVDYGVNPDFFSASWNPSPQPELLFLGSISRRKGIADLIAVAKLPEMSHIRFRIAGEGELRAELEAASTPNVEWLGKCGRDEVIRHMESAWGMVIPTYSDTGPTVVKEARVVGLPIVTTTGAGACSYVIEGDCGHVTAPGDLDALASGIMNLCRSRDTCLALGASSWQEHREILHSKTTAKKLADLYRNQTPSSANQR
jgi:glycosyltransferase involved in cell wall biosynthesis